MRQQKIDMIRNKRHIRDPKKEKIWRYMKANYKGNLRFIHPQHMFALLTMYKMKQLNIWNHSFDSIIKKSKKHRR